MSLFIDDTNSFEKYFKNAPDGELSFTATDQRVGYRLYTMDGPFGPKTVSVHSQIGGEHLEECTRDGHPYVVIVLFTKIAAVKKGGLPLVEAWAARGVRLRKSYPHILFVFSKDCLVDGAFMKEVGTAVKKYGYLIELYTSTTAAVRRVKSIRREWREFTEVS